VTIPPPEDETLDELGAVADELLEQAAALRKRWQELGDVLGVDLEPVAEPAPQRGAREDERSVTPMQPASRTPNEPELDDVHVAVRSDYGGEIPDPVRVVVFDMMLSGRSRKEVKEYVRKSFGSDADLTVVDELFDTR
jgi:hypothetical protein